ncbi:MAG: glycolate oxidase subunit GlcF [Pseudomonadales bacterium]|nr:glycolate oxidase subunit GlcF [Pseudomonadales bacterium]
MQTFLPVTFLDSSRGREADSILRSCVHCGFCTATCPTYLLTGNELDSPRGRIYLIKEMLETETASAITRSHLDRCLSCQSCETTCPSNVQYHHLLNTGRAYLEDKVPRSLPARGKRLLLRKGLSSPGLFNMALTLGQIFRVILPEKLKRLVPVAQHSGTWPMLQSTRRMLILNGCVQNSLSPNTNAAAARVLARLGIQPVSLPKEGCCGALSYHLNAQSAGLKQARQQIDRLCQALDDGVEAIVSSASGCGNFIKDYAKLLAADAAYAAKAERIVVHTRDLSEILMAEDLAPLKVPKSQTLAFHCPCSLQHGQRLGGAVETILREIGFDLSVVQDPHLCCGSAGTYSILQPTLARQLRSNKIAALEAAQADAIATANIGCQSHLGAATHKPVRHWIEYVDQALNAAETSC